MIFFVDTANKEVQGRGPSAQVWQANVRSKEATKDSKDHRPASYVPPGSQLLGRKIPGGDTMFSFENQINKPLKLEKQIPFYAWAF